MHFIHFHHLHRLRINHLWQAFAKSANPVENRYIAEFCRIPDDCIDLKRYPLLMAREVMRGLITELQSKENVHGNQVA